MAEHIAEEIEGPMTLQSLTAAITEWHVETFGHRSIERRLARKLFEEANEVAVPLSLGTLPISEIEGELADVLIVLCAIAGRNGIDLLDAAERKFEIVRARGASQIERDAKRGIGAE